MNSAGAPGDGAHQGPRVREVLCPQGHVHGQVNHRDLLLLHEGGVAAKPADAVCPVLNPLAWFLAADRGQ